MDNYEGEWIECPRCHGNGTEIRGTYHGLFGGKKEEEIICILCSGSKRIFRKFSCPLERAPCMGKSCCWWDRTNGGCMPRKFMEKYLKRMEII